MELVFSGCSNNAALGAVTSPSSNPLVVFPGGLREPSPTAKFSRSCLRLPFPLVSASRTWLPPWSSPLSRWSSISLYFRLFWASFREISRMSCCWGFEVPVMWVKVLGGVTSALGATKLFRGSVYSASFTVNTWWLLHKKLENGDYLILNLMLSEWNPLTILYWRNCDESSAASGFSWRY